MRKYTILTFIMLPLLLSGLTIDETMNQIAVLKKELADSTRVVNLRIDLIKKTSPLFAEKDMFESDSLYMARLNQGMRKINDVSEPVHTIKSKLYLLRTQCFDTNNLDISVSSYNADTQKLELTAIHKDYQQECIKFTYTAENDLAKTLVENWGKTVIKGILIIDMLDKISLIKICIFEPTSNITINYDTGFVWNVCSYRGDYLNSSAVSPDDRYVALNYDGHLFKIFSVETRKEVYSKKLDHQYYFMERDLIFSSDSKTLVIAGETVYFVDLVTDEGVTMWVDDDRTLQAKAPFTIMPDGKSILTASGSIINIQSRTQQSWFKFSEPVLDLKVSPNGRFLAVMTNVPTRRFEVAKTNVIIFNFETKQEAMRFNLEGRLKSICFDSDGAQIMFGYGDNVHIYNLISKKEQQIIDKCKGDLKFNPVYKTLVGGSYVGKSQFFRIYNIDKSKLQTYIHVSTDSPCNGFMCDKVVADRIIDVVDKTILSFGTHTMFDGNLYNQDKGYSVSQDGRYSLSQDGRYICVGATVYPTFEIP